MVRVDFQSLAEAKAENSGLTWILGLSERGGLQLWAMQASGLVAPLHNGAEGCDTAAILVQREAPTQALAEYAAGVCLGWAAYDWLWRYRGVKRGWLDRQINQGQVRVGHLAPDGTVTTIGKGNPALFPLEDIRAAERRGG